VLTASAVVRDRVPSNEELVLSIDVGTQSTRAALVDLRGDVLDLVRTPVQPYFSQRPGWAEQHAETYWDALCGTSRQLLARSGAPAGRIIAVALTTQRGTYVNVDRDGTPLRPAIVWLDQRKASIDGLIPAFSVPLLKAAGVYSFVEYITRYCRSNWLRQNQPEIWRDTYKFLCLSGYLTQRLTGEFRDSTGNIVGTMPIDVKRSRWSGKWDLKTRLFFVEREKLPELVFPGELLGEITARASQLSGIPAGLPLIAASNDKACEILGAGCMTPDTACISFGTTATLNTHNTEYVEVKRLMPPFASAVPQQFYTEIGVLRGLWMVSWFKEEFGLQERLRAKEGSVSPESLLDELLREVPPGAMGLVLQPYWTPGPDLEAYAKGSIIGFGDIHTRAHLYRSVVEGLVFALKEGAELTERKNAVAIRRVRAAGGGSQSDGIVQITADVFGLPVERPHTHETAVVGAAIDAAVGLKRYPSFDDAVASMTRVCQVFEPIAENVELYRKLYERVYRKMYGRLLPLFREIQEITGYPKL
jgi:sugar (pentulose or hexulose) kinase